MELAYRFSDYSNAGRHHTYKVAGDWTVVDGLRFRAGYNRAVRAPNVTELFAPQNVVLDGTRDPCALLGSGKTAADPVVQRCATVFHLTPAQVLNIEPDPANQYNGNTSGNPDLKPEKADTYTVGVVWSPTFVPGLNFTLDYFDIDVKDYISTIGADTIINGCVNGGNNAYCALVHRDANGTIRTTNGFVNDPDLQPRRPAHLGHRRSRRPTARASTPSASATPARSPSTSWAPGSTSWKPRR